MNSIFQMFQARIQNFLDAVKFRAPKFAHVIKTLVDGCELLFVLQPHDKNSNGCGETTQKRYTQSLHCFFLPIR